jgi:hypothetical protein
MTIDLLDELTTSVVGGYVADVTKVRNAATTSQVSGVQSAVAVLYPTVAAIRSDADAATTNPLLCTTISGVLTTFAWSGSSTAADDGVSVIQLTGVTTGRFLRVGTYASGPAATSTTGGLLTDAMALTFATLLASLDYVTFEPTGTADDSAALNDLMATMHRHQWVYFKPGLYYFVTEAIAIGYDSPRWIWAPYQVEVHMDRMGTHPQPSSTAIHSAALVNWETGGTTTLTAVANRGASVIQVASITTPPIAVDGWVVISYGGATRRFWATYQVKAVVEVVGVGWNVTLDRPIKDTYAIGEEVRSPADVPMEWTILGIGGKVHGQGERSAWSTTTPRVTSGNSSASTTPATTTRRSIASTMARKKSCS